MALMYYETHGSGRPLVLLHGGEKPPVSAARATDQAVGRGGRTVGIIEAVVYPFRGDTLADGASGAAAFAG